MRTNVLNDLSNVVKKGTILAVSWAGVGRISEEGAIEHPLSTHSAPFGIRWKPAGEKGSTRVWKHVAMIFAVLVMSMANIGMAWGADINDYATGFETTTDSWSKDGGTAGVLTRFARTGTGGAWHASNTTSAGNKRVKLAIGTTSGAKNTTYQHVIGYVRKGVGTSNTLTTKVEVYIGSSLGMSDALTLSTSWQRISYSKNKTSAWNSSATQIRFTTNFSTSKADTVYFDDLIWYSNTSATIDLTRPSRATSASATTSSIYWTNGSDTGEGATGIQATLIFHRTGGSVGGNDLTLNDQGIYSLTATEGPKVVGNWTLLSASVGAAATSYSGTFEAGHEYAIVHRDLAYNYSAPTYVTVSAAPSCTAPNHVDISGNWDYFGGETISLSAQAYSSAGTGSPIAEGSITGYQWKHNGVNIAGATSKTFTKSNCTVSDAGDYSCVVSTGATCSTESSLYGTKVYVLQQYIGGETTYNFTRIGSSQAGTVEVTLPASTQREFKIYAGSTASTTYYMGNNGTIDEDASNWDFEGGKNNVKLNPGLGGTFIFSIDYSANGGAPKVSVTYPRKRIYLSPGVWKTPSDGEKFAYNYYRDGGSGGWTDFLTEDDCGMYADIPQWNGVILIPARLKNTTVSPGSWDDRWNQTNNITVTSNDYVTITGWNASDFTYTTYSTPTYTISYNAGTGGSGSKSNETKTCGVDFTLPNSAVFTRTGYTQTGWTTSDGGAQEYALGGTYTTNEDKTFYPVWTVNNYDLTWNLGGGTTTSAGTGIASGVSSNTTTSQAFGTALTAPTVTKTGYNFSAWSPAVASTMPAANTTYTATWTVKTTTITIEANTANHGSTAPSPITATYGSALPSFTAAAGASGYSLTGYFTTATSGTKVINADGTLVAGTDYADGSGKWKYETSTLTLYPQYEEEAGGGDCEELFVCIATSATACTATTGSATYNIASSGGGSCSIGGYSYYIKPNSNNVIVASPKEGKSFAAGDSLIFVVYNPNATAKTIGFVLASSTTDYTHEVAAGKLHYFRQKLAAADISNGKVSFSRKSGDDRWIGVTIKHCETASCTTPAAPTGFTAGSITSTGATFTITDAAGAASYDIYYSTSSTAPTASTAATVTSDSKTKAVTGLTASTTYYAWVRSVCDADHKSAWVALSGSSFTTTAAGPEALIYWIVTVDASTWSLNGSPTTTDGTNITSISSSIDAASSPSTGASGTTAKVALAAASDNVSNAASFTFTVNSAKKVEPERVTCQVFNVGSGSGDQLSYKAQLSDNNGHVYYSTNSVKPASAATLTDATFTFASDLVLTGNVTMKVYGYQDGGTKGTAFRMGADVKLFGEVQNAADYTVTHTMSNVTKSAGATSVKEGNNYTATYAGAGGYALPSTITVTIGGSPATAGTDYTWTQGTGVVTIPGNKVTGNIVITVTGVAVVNYSITYHCNGAESGCPSNVAATTNLPSPLPTGMTKDGYDFGGWFTDSECTVAAVAGAALTGNTDLYAKWTERGSGCEDTPHAWDVIATSAKSYKVRISKVTEEVAIPVADATASNLTAYAGSVSTNDNVTVQIADGGSSKYGYKFDGSNTYLKLVFSTPLVLNDTLVVGMTNASHNISFTTTAVRSTTLSTSGGKLIIPAALAGQSTLYLWRGSGSTMYLRSFAVKHECEAIPSCTTPTLPTATLSNQTVCEGADIAAWDATPTNASTISSKSESIAYSWKKKGSETVLGTGATFDLGASAAESQAGTYVVTVTVSKAGYASATATKEVTLTVNEATEVTAIVADKATVYPGNSVTLTATANMDATWNWYLCANADGTGAGSSLGTSSSYTIASAGAAGTYYYKAVATGDCGIGSMVYTLTVSEAAGGDCFHFVSVIPASDFNASSGASLVTPTHATTLEGGTMTVGSQQVTFTKDYGLKMEGTKTVSITLDAALEAGNVVIVKGTSATKGYGIIINGVNFYDADNKTFDVSYTVSADDGLEGQTALTVSKYSGSSYLQEVKITGCGESCTDPEVTASADNTTACVGTSVTFTAANAHASADYQWQKLDGTWTNISGATESTYTIASVVAGDAGKYRVIATHDCSRTSNEVTLSVPVAPVFGSFTATRSVMATLALSITDVEASDATSYAWYKSADATYDAGSDTRVGTAQELLLAAGGEAAGDTYYLFCVASNSCGSTTSSAITVNVIALVEEDCATKGNEGAADFGFENSGCSDGSIESTACYTSNSRSKYLTYTAPDGKYFNKAKVTVAVSSGSKCGYAYSTDGSTWTYAELTGLSGTLTEKTIELTGNITHFRISRNLQDGSSVDHGVTSGTFYLSKICFEYTDACTATTVTPSTESTSYEMGDEWSNPTFTLTPAAVSGETLTYSSSNEDIASVDDDGTVTFNGNAGTVTITASYAGGTISETEYCASSGSYTITVSCPGDAPKVVADGSVNMSGCNSSVILNAKKQDGTTDFTGGSYQWFRNGEEIDGATSSSYTAAQTGVYTVAYTSAGGCTSPSTNSATVSSATVEPEVTKLVPFQYYHVDKTYSDQMKDRHLFSVKGSAEYGSTGKNFKLTMSRNGGEAVDMTTAASIFVTKSGDGQIDTVMIDLNKLSGKYSEGDELVLTCAAVNCSGNVSAVYKDEITINVIGTTPTLALICSGSSKAGGTRKTGELTVGGDFLTGYNVADLCQQTGNTSFDANTEWGLYTELKEAYIVTPVNGYAVFNKLNYEPFDILLLTDYPKASKSDAAKDVLDDMAALCDYRPMLSFKTHMVAKSPSKWAAKGFTTSATENKEDGRLNLNIVCYAHPMFNSLKTGEDVYTDVGNTSAPLVYTMLSGTGYESSKGMQGFELAAAENFITIGLTHYNGTIAKDSPDPGEVEWTPGSGDRMLVTVAERQANPEARFILFSLNCGAQSKLTDKGEEVILACLNYLLGTAEGTINPADCSFTFDNGASNEHDAAWYASNCPLCTGTKGDGLWTTAANWGPDYRLLPGEFTSVRIKKPVEVNDEHAHVMEVRLIDEGSIDIPAGKALDVKSTIRRMDGSEIYPTEENDIHVGSASTGNGTLIFNNDEGDTKAQVDMYSKGFIDGSGEKNFQYIGTPFVEVNALYNYYGSWIYWWNGSNWKAVKNGGPMTAWTGYCITQEAPTYHQMSGTLTATTTVDIPVGAGQDMVVGNSWTAPIDINAMTTEDFENLTANVYFFNTGVEKDHTMTGHVNDGIDRYAGSTYVTVPIHSAPYTGDDHIPSLQGFFVTSSGSAGTLHLDYDKHVRGTTRDNILSGAMHAPARRAAVNSNEPTVLKIKVSGENYDDKLLLLEREDFTEGFDNGWDGDKWDGNESALYIYTTDSEGTENSVSAIPELEGTVIGFRAGEDDAYTLNFEYLNSDEPLYLYDVENNTYTQIITGMTYRFFTTDNEKHERFIITRSNGQEVPTDIGNGEASGGARAKKFILNDKMYIMINGMLYDATGKVVK